MPNTALDKIRRKAVELRKKHGGSYQANLKRAGKMYREGKISGTTKKRSKKKPIRKRHGHRMTGVPEGNHRSVIAAAERSLKEQLGWAMATQATARTQKEKRALGPKIAELKNKLKALTR